MPSIISATTTNGVTVTGDNSGSLQLATNNGTTAVTIDTAQLVGIGTSSPSEKLEINNGNLAVGNAGSNFTMKVSRTGANASSVVVGAFTNEPDIQWTYTGSGALRFTDSTASAERMRITSSGQLFVNNTTDIISGALDNVQIGVTAPSSNIQYGMMIGGNGTGFTVNAIRFVNTYTPAVVGTITIGSSSTAYNTSSDYRLKENVAPMTGALAKVVQLKPVTYTWKATGETSQGFIAHELQAIVPDCVTGEKDAIDEEGNPVHQGVDTSFLVATLTAAIKELKAELDATKAEVQALKVVA